MMSIHLKVTGVMLTIVSIFFCLCMSTLSASNTFFSHRSMQSDISIFNTTSDAFINRNKPSDRFDFSATVFYQESTNAKDLARYFLPGGKTEITIGGINAPGTPDVSGTWLQIAGTNDPAVPVHFPDSGLVLLPDGNPRTVANEDLYLNQFSSKVSIRPEFKRFGTVLRAFKSFSYCSHQFWFDVVLPFVQVQTDLKLKEFDIQNEFATRDDIPTFVINDDVAANTRIERPTASTMLNGAEALNNPAWKYGKFKQGTQKIAGLADITLRLGYLPIKNEQLIWNIYSNFVIPTSYKPKSENVFEPILGNGAHFGLGFGTSLDLEIFADACYQSHFTTNFEYAYLFRNTQVRSFDLIPNGEWSRYLLVFSPTGAPLSGENKTPTSGINVFSDRMHVTPQSEINWTSALNFDVKGWSFHVGYNLWWRQKEKVRLEKSWDKQVAIMHFPVNGGAVAPFTLESFSTATIKDHFLGVPGALNAGADPSIVLVKAEDINLDSAAHPSVIGHKIFGTIGYTLQWACQPIDLLMGGSYQVNENMKTVQDWSIWMQVSLPI